MVESPAMSEKDKRPLWTAEEVAAALKGMLSSNNGRDWTATGVSLSDWTIHNGDLVIATDRRNWPSGYGEYARTPPEVAAKGAAALIDSETLTSPPDGCAVWTVPNTRKALTALSQFARARMTGKVIAVTGSVGKTTTREAIRHVLARQGTARSNLENANDGIGIAHALANTPATTSYGIYECSMLGPGSVSPKSRMVKPHVAVVTEIQPEHLEFHASSEAIAAEKACIFDALEPGGVAVINTDALHADILIAEAHRKGAAKVVTFGSDPAADVRIQDYEPGADGTFVKVQAFGEPIEFRMSTPGSHMASIGAGVLAVVAAVGADWRKAAVALAEFTAISGRSNRAKIDWHTGTIDLIDGSFSTSPASIRSMLEIAGVIEPAPGRRRIAVLGEMKELGSGSAKLHAELAPDIRDAKIDKLFTIGADMLHVRRVLPEKMLGRHCDSIDTMVRALASTVKAGDVVAVKGSARGGGFDRLISGLKDAGKAPQPERSLLDVGEPVRIETPDFIIRSLAVADVDERFAAWFSDQAVMRFVNLNRGQSVATIRRRVADADNRRFYYLGLYEKQANAPVGFCQIDFSVPNKRAHVIPVIGDEAFRNEDKLQQVALNLAEFLFSSPAAHKIVARVYHRDELRLSVYRKLGFVVEGVLREHEYRSNTWCDIIEMAILRSEWLARIRNERRA
jgi:UDP-N-acetylmuramoyl-tripeptide--D-alanyl-D-alanine ligase